MASLEDFAPQSEGATLEDFQIEGPLVPISNKPSNTNLAAYTAALSENPESVEANYLAISSQLDSQGDSLYANELVKRATSVSLEKDRAALVSVLTDDTVDDETKQAVANQFADERNPIYSLRNIVSTESLVADVDNETQESSDARINFSESVQRVNDYHREVQTILNHELNSQDSNLVEMSAGFLEVLAPYVEQGITEQVISDVRSGDPTAWMEAITMMGDAKATLREGLLKMPPEKRAEAAQIIADSINANSSIVFPDKNDFVTKDFLLSALQEGYYGDFDRWVDNIVSLADLALPFVPFLGRGVKLAGRTVRSLRAGRSTALETPAAERGLAAAEGEVATVERSFAETATDAEMRAAEDAAEAEMSDRRLRAEEDASEARIGARQQEVEADPVRRAEDAAERRAEARRAVQTDSPSLKALEDAQERRAEAIRKGGAAARMTDDELASAERAYELELARKRAARTDVKPVTISQNYRNTNPSKARAANQLAGDDTTGQAANALYGTSRTEAVAFDSLGDVHRSDDMMQNRVGMPDAYTKARPQPANPRVMDVVSSNGALYLTDTEKLTTATRVINDFNNVMGLTTRNEMVVPRAADDLANTFNIGVTYGPRDSGWSSGRDAVEKVKTSLRDYGVKDEDITLMTRVGDDYAPIRVEDATEGGDYLVRVDYPYTFNASEIEDWSDLDVVWNFLDRLPPVTSGSGGSLQRHIIDAHSMLHPNITFGSNVSVDRAAQLEKVLVELTKDFSDKYNKLGKLSQAALEKEIKRANKEGRNATDTSLRADGWGDEELSALKKWREVWDTVYWLENQDMVKTLRNRNYKVLEDPSSDTRLFVKELGRPQAGSFKRAYDPQTGEMVNLKAEDLTNLYEKGGAVSTLRSPVVDGDEAIEFVITRNQPGGPYARRIRDDDQVLNYREGYYTVYYQDPKFIDRVVRDSRGNILKRSAVATAKDTPTATRFQKRFQMEAEDNVEYVVRDNRERHRFDSDDNWNLQEAQGRTAQRVRGERLEDATSPIYDEAHENVLGPVDSLVRSARNVSTRVPMRDYLEATKARAIRQYGHMFPKGKFGQPEFPSSRKQVKADEGFSKEAADARTLVEYVNMLEHGYINIIDDGIKMGLRAIADAAGKKKMGIAERAANFAAEQGGPTRLGRGVAFTLYLALNPLRQVLVQSHQAIQLIPRNPKYVFNNLVGDMGAILEYKASGKVAAMSKIATGRTEEELLELARAYESSGLSAAIDKSNLVRGSLSEIADATSAGGYRRTPLARAIGKFSQGIGFVRKAGFDAGEEINMLSSWLVHYDLEKRRVGGKPLTKTQLDRVTARARDYTYNMNRAGDMPYNENALGMIFQFMQVPHKAFLQMTTNRNLSRMEKAKLAGWNLLMYGGPPGTLLSVYMNDLLPEQGEIREAVLQGMEGYMFNKLATLMYGEDVSIDYSSLAATDGTGLMEFIGSLWTTDMGKVLAESPSGSLFAGSNPRITNFMRTAAQYFNFVEPVDNNPVTTGELFKEFASLSSGFSSAFRARTALEYEKKYNSYGGVTDSSVNTPEAIAQIFGLQTLNQARNFWVSSEIYEGRKGFDEDVKEWYKLVKQRLAAEGITNEEREFSLRVLNVAAEQFKDTPRAQEIIQQQLRYDVRNGDMSLHNSILSSFPWMDRDKAKEIVNNAPGTDEQKELRRRTFEYIDNYRNQFEE